jgi:DHA2 family multidrug resistance protein
MGALYVRGLGMGMLFTPLSTIALMKIPRSKMAQASGLFNVIRQIGGSFGVAMFGTMLTRRIIYHSALNGESVNQYSAAFRNMQYHMQNFVQQTTGGNGNAVTTKAKALIGQHIISQSFVQAINDDFFLAGAITCLCLVPILFLRTKKKKSNEHIAIME